MSHSSPQPTQPPCAQLSLNSSRLIRALAELDVLGDGASVKDFGSRFGELFALTDSIGLSDMHYELTKLRFQPREQPADTIIANFIDQRQALLELIGRNFLAGPEHSRVRNRYPAFRNGLEPEQLCSFEPYQRFYAALQRQMDFEVQHIQSFVRDGAAGLSAELAKLVLLDSTLGDTLNGHARKLFPVVPRLLGVRFAFLHQQHQQSEPQPEHDQPANWIGTGGWLDQFRLDCHMLLLAELDIRMQPVLGLIEAIEEHQAPTTTLTAPPTSAASPKQSHATPTTNRTPS